MRDRELRGAGLSVDVAERVEPVVAAVRSASWARHVIAVAVVGSAARGEEAWSGGRLVSDIDLMVVTDTENVLLARRIELLLDRFASLGIEGGRVPLRRLGSYATLEAFEARTSGVVVLGDASVLASIPVTEAGELPKWEAVRLLLNRSLEHVKLDLGLTSPERCLGKTFEAIGDALLVRRGRYRPSFAARFRELVTMPESQDIVDAYAWALSRRAGELVSPPAGIAASRRRLLDAAGQALDDWVGVEQPLDAHLRHLARFEHHALHRAYAVALGLAGKGVDARYVLTDPILVVWRDAVAALRGVRPPTVDLYRQWSTVPQIRMRPKRREGAHL